MVSIPDFLPPSSSYSRRVQTTPLLTTFFSLFFRSPLRRRRRPHKNGGSNIQKRPQPPWAGTLRAKRGHFCVSPLTVYLCSNTFLTWNKSREEGEGCGKQQETVYFIYLVVWKEGSCVIFAACIFTRHILFIFRDVKKLVTHSVHHTALQRAAIPAKAKSAAHEGIRYSQTLSVVVRTRTW